MPLTYHISQVNINYCLICSRHIVPITRQVLKVLSDILSAADTGSLSMLTLLDLLAAFDTVDHLILLRRLQTSYGLGGIVLAWLTSYLSTEHSTSTVANPPRPLCQSCLGCHRVRSSGRSCFCYIQRTWCGWLSLSDCNHICTPTTRKSTARAVRVPPITCSVALLTVSPPSPTGCDQIGFS